MKIFEICAEVRLPGLFGLEKLLTIFQASANTLKSKLPHEIGKLLPKPESGKPTSSRKGSFLRNKIKGIQPMTTKLWPLKDNETIVIKQMNVKLVRLRGT